MLKNWGSGFGPTFFHYLNVSLVLLSDHRNGTVILLLKCLCLEVASSRLHVQGVSHTKLPLRLKQMLKWPNPSKLGWRHMVSVLIYCLRKKKLPLVVVSSQRGSFSVFPVSSIRRQRTSRHCPRVDAAVKRKCSAHAAPANMFVWSSLRGSHNRNLCLIARTGLTFP